MQVALCTRNRGNPVIQLIGAKLADAGADPRIVTDPRLIDEPGSFDVGFWRPDSRDRQTAAFSRQVPEILEGADVPFVNSLASCDRALNKYVAYALFRSAGLQTPATELAPTSFDPPGSFEVPWDAIVAKPLEGKASRGVAVLSSTELALDYAKRQQEPFVFQEAVPWLSLIRIVVTRDGAVRAFEQENPNGSAEPTVASFDRDSAEPLSAVAGEAEHLAMQMLASVGGDFMRADLLKDREGSLWALEINSSFGFPHSDSVILDQFVSMFEQTASRT